MRVASLVSWSVLGAGILAAAVLSGCVPRSTVAPETPYESESASPVAESPQPRSPAEIAARARRSVVVIRTEVGLGTGFVVAPNVVVTNLHVLTRARTAELFFADGAHSKTDSVLAIDVDHDLALLPLPESPPAHEPLRLGDDLRLRPGDGVLALGTPEGLDFTVSTGVVGAVRAVNPELTLLQITTPISPGSSGGPLLDERGEVVGVTTLTITRGQNLNFAVPTRYVRALLARPPAPLRFAQHPAPPPKGRGSPNDQPTTDKAYPDAVAGFHVGITLADARHACPGKMKEKRNLLECSTAAVPVPFANGPVTLYFGNGRLVSVELRATSFEDARLALTNRYGTPRRERSSTQPNDGSIQLTWAFQQGGTISVRESGGQSVHVFYAFPIWDDANNY